MFKGLLKVIMYVRLFYPQATNGVAAMHRHQLACVHLGRDERRFSRSQSEPFFGLWSRSPHAGRLSCFDFLQCLIRGQCS